MFLKFLKRLSFKANLVLDYLERKYPKCVSDMYFKVCVKHLDEYLLDK